MSVEISGPAVPGVLAAPLAVAGCATAAVTMCLDAAADLARARTGHRPAVTVDTAHVAAAVRGETLLRGPDGRGIDGFAPLSRLWPAADGWVRTHANYPWHRAALLAALDTDEAGVAAAIASRSALAVERLVYATGGLAVASRTPDEWLAEQSAPTPGSASAGAPPGPLARTVPPGTLQRATPAGPPVRTSPPGTLERATPAGPLVRTTPLGTGTARGAALAGAAADRAAGRVLPAAGIRVLDLTRVIAGPVGTRMLGALGADVLRVDDPARPELPLHAVDGVVGKASTTIDARTVVGLQTLHRLLDTADVLVTGYRPGALRRLGLDPDQVADRHPGTIVVTLSAWGTTGPWGTRRGFDSLVQIATGIGRLTGDATGRPGALPCQLLDHATGYLAAAGALSALAARERTGAAAHVEVSLARTARWLLDSPLDPAPPLDTPTAPYLVPLGAGWTGVGPPGTFDGAPLTWPRLPPAYGRAPAAWQ